ncbi:MAG TPA: DUF2203 domain-containing protein [Dongiaceae bacterium]|jgi:hypothetical protein|nr:DUF2203 domain-containing protein [Dongiaceae bacterium]
MAYRFSKHYTREEATALLPQVRAWLREVNEFREQLVRHDRKLSGLRGGGEDLGGNLVGEWIKVIADLKAVLDEFQRREIFIKDVERGLLDFPALMGGKEVFLCWEQDEPAVEFWHDLDAGFAGREPL